jgi:GH43 family beta-xylosidase
MKSRPHYRAAGSAALALALSFHMEAPLRAAPFTAPLSLAPATRRAPVPALPVLPARAQRPTRTFSNPIVKDRAAADPYMTHRAGWYYLLFTTGGSVEIWASRSMTDWSAARKQVVWRKPATGPMSNDVWAPEVHWLDGRWYIYMTATDDAPQRDPNRRVYVLESVGPDIFGAYVPRGQIKPVGSDEYAIDGSIFEHKGKRYFIWSGRDKSASGAQNIYIAPMANPWTLSGPRVMLSTPEFEWEKHGWWVNEGPTILSHGGRTWLVYSASGAATPFYALGMLELKGADPLDPKSWVKSPEPVFKMNDDPQGGAYTVGHGSFVPSPDGTEMWNIYHGKDKREDNWNDRTARADVVRWREDGSPYFGAPTPSGVLIPLPSGEVALSAPLTR